LVSIPSHGPQCSWCCLVSREIGGASIRDVKGAASEQSEESGDEVATEECWASGIRRSASLAKKTGVREVNEEIASSKYGKK